jgi:hypothetical protein
MYVISLLGDKSIPELSSCMDMALSAPTIDSSIAASTIFH